MSASQEIRVPDIGGVTEVEVIEILVQVGDIIEIEQPLITLETDKATMEVPSPSSGTVVNILVTEGSKVSQGSAILSLETTSAPNEIKSTEQIAATAQVKEQPIAKKMETPSISQTQTTAKKNVAASTGISAIDKESIAYASPSVRKLAHQFDINLLNVKGSGSKGRIIKEDVQAYIKLLIKKEHENTPVTESENSPFKDMLPWPQVDFSKFGPVRREKISRIRKISSANLHRNWVSIPHVTNHEDADITDLEAFRVQLNQQHEKLGIKVTMVALILKAVVAALKKFPAFNASLDGDEIVLKDYYHIGFAADTPNGLMVPVLRDADKKGILEIANEVTELAVKARDGKLSVADMSGGCFSISSLGGIGGTYFTPIINAPEIAILGIARARTELKWNGKEAEPRLILPMSLSWDHRAVDGAQAGRFNAYLASLLADIRLIMV